MEIIANIEYKEELHSVHNFLKEYYRHPPLLPIMSHVKVAGHMDGHNLIDAMANIISSKWNTMLVSKNQSVGQRTTVELADGNNVSINLLSSGDRVSRMCCMIIGDDVEIQHIVVGFVGNESKFKEWMVSLSISEIEIYSDIIHLVLD